MTPELSQVSMAGVIVLLLVGLLLQRFTAGVRETVNPLTVEIRQLREALTRFTNASADTLINHEQRIEQLERARTV